MFAVESFKQLVQRIIFRQQYHDTLAMASTIVLITGEDIKFKTSNQPHAVLIWATQAPIPE